MTIRFDSARHVEQTAEAFDAVESTVARLWA